MHATDRTLVVLTMCDLVIDKHWEAKIFKPLLGKSEALAHATLRGIFGVVNRELDGSGADTERLSEAETREERWLEAQLAKLRVVSDEDRRRVVSCLSVGNLVKAVDTVFHEREWGAVELVRWPLLVQWAPFASCRYL